MSDPTDVDGRLNAAADKAENASEIMRRFANDPAGVYIPTETGLLPSILQWLQLQSDSIGEAVALYDDLTDSSDPLKGAAIAGRGVVSIASVKDLLSAKKDVSLTYLVAAYYPGVYATAAPDIMGGSGRWVWAPNVPRSKHNGGTVISPTVPWSGAQATLAAFLSATGETAPAANGCFVLCADGAVTVKGFGAKGDNSADDFYAMQKAFDIGRLTSTIVRITSGTYKTSQSLTVDYTSASYINDSYSNKVHIIGDGAVCTTIKSNSGAFAAIQFLGNSQNNTSFMVLSGLRLLGSFQSAGSFGLVFNKGAFVEIRDVIVELFDKGIYAVDFEQIALYNTHIRFNGDGVIGLGGTMTSPNSWSWYNCTVGNNSRSGLSINNANAFNWDGGSIQYNGYIGGGNTHYGALFSEAGNDGYGNICFKAMAFEGNGGLGDLISVQTGPNNKSNIALENVSFIRTGSFFSASILGAANNGSGAIRLTLDSTAAIAGKPKVFIYGVVGTVPANNAVPWSFTVIDATHIDLIGSAFSGTYTSGGKVTIVGFGENQIRIDGDATDCIYSWSKSNFKTELNYAESATRPAIGLNNPNAKICDDGSNVFESSVERPNYPQSQIIGDDGSGFSIVPVTLTAGGGTFAANGTLRIKKVNKIVTFSMDAVVTSYAATPTGAISVPMPWPAAGRNTFACVNFTTVFGANTFMQPGASVITIFSDGSAFPVNANGQRLVMSGSYETT